jgi:hypothetical protein
MPLHLPTTVQETKKAILLQAPLKTRASDVAVDVSPWSVSINQRPYFVRLYFSSEVDPSATQLTVNESAKTIALVLPKAATDVEWGPVLTLSEEVAVEQGLPTKIEAWRTSFLEQVCERDRV